MFTTRYNSIPFEGEVNSGEIKIDPGGYVPLQQQIENMTIRANQNITDDYDYAPGVDIDTYDDPTLEPDYDVADAHQDGLALAERVAERGAAHESQSDASLRAETQVEQTVNEPS